MTTEENSNKDTPTVSSLRTSIFDKANRLPYKMAATTLLMYACNIWLIIDLTGKAGSLSLLSQVEHAQAVKDVVLIIYPTIVLLTLLLTLGAVNRFRSSEEMRAAVLIQKMRIDRGALPSNWQYEKKSMKIELDACEDELYGRLIPRAKVIINKLKEEDFPTCKTKEVKVTKNEAYIETELKAHFPRASSTVERMLAQAANGLQIFEGNSELQKSVWKENDDDEYAKFPEFLGFFIGALTQYADDLEHTISREERLRTSVMGGREERQEMNTLDTKVKQLRTYAQQLSSIHDVSLVAGNQAESASDWCLRQYIGP